MVMLVYVAEHRNVLVNPSIVQYVLVSSPLTYRHREYAERKFPSETD